MNVVQQIVSFIKTIFTWWLIVEPWQQAVRVRFGKRVRMLAAGVHLRIPLFDIIYCHNVRRRISTIPIQTLTTRDGKMITVHGTLGYAIADVMLLHTMLHDAESTIVQEVQGLISEHVATSDLVQCTPQMIKDAVTVRLKLERYGLTNVEFFLIGYVANVRTIRLIQDPVQYAYTTSEMLSTRDALRDSQAPR